LIQEIQEIVKMHGIKKVYSNGVIACNEVDFSAYLGEIHAVMGENGAGKTTLMKILFGMEKPDSGEIYIKGEKTVISSPQSAIKNGIGMVHQHFMLVPSLTVAENMMLGMEPRKKGIMVNYSMAKKLTEEACKKYNLHLNPSEKVFNLSVGSRQKLEILKALVRGAKILILDEPTAVLTPQETAELFIELKKFREIGITIIFISHKIHEIKEICDRITIMRNGRVMGVHNVSDVTEQQISKLMVGRDAILSICKSKCKPTEVVLDIKDLICYKNDGKVAVDRISFSLRRGEILGIAGIEGNGQQQLVEVLTGLSSKYSGNVKICGNNIKNKDVHKIRNLGMSHIPQDRMSFGVALKASISDNLISEIVQTKEFNGRILMRIKKIKEYVNTAIDNFKIKCTMMKQPVSTLSGGNIQKVVVSRELSLATPLVIADQPTRGVDVGASELIRNKLVEMRDNGSGILLVSADLNEVIELSDSIVVMYGGKIVAFIEDGSYVSEEQLGEYMLGLASQSEEIIRGVMHV